MDTDKIRFKHIQELQEGGAVQAALPLSVASYTPTVNPAAFFDHSDLEEKPETLPELDLDLIIKGKGHANEKAYLIDSINSLKNEISKEAMNNRYFLKSSRGQSMVEELQRKVAMGTNDLERSVVQTEYAQKRIDANGAELQQVTDRHGRVLVKNNETGETGYIDLFTAGKQDKDGRNVYSPVTHKDAITGRELEYIDAKAGWDLTNNMGTIKGSEAINDELKKIFSVKGGISSSFSDQQYTELTNLMNSDPSGNILRDLAAGDIAKVTAHTKDANSTKALNEVRKTILEGTGLSEEAMKGLRVIIGNNLHRSGESKGMNREQFDNEVSVRINARLISEIVKQNDITSDRSTSHTEAQAYFGAGLEAAANAREGDLYDAGDYKVPGFRVDPNTHKGDLLEKTPLAGLLNFTKALYGNVQTPYDGKQVAAASTLASRFKATKAHIVIMPVDKDGVPVIKDFNDTERAELQKAQNTMTQQIVDANGDKVKIADINEVYNSVLDRLIANKPGVSKGNVAVITGIAVGEDRNNFWPWIPKGTGDIMQGSGFEKLRGSDQSDVGAGSGIGSNKGGGDSYSGTIWVPLKKEVTTQRAMGALGVQHHENYKQGGILNSDKVLTFKDLMNL